MEALYQIEQDIAKKIQNASNMFGRDGSSKKCSREYFTKRIDELESDYKKIL